MKKALFLFLLWNSFYCLFAQQQIIYVDSAATGKNDGTTWENAFTDLQSALNLPITPLQVFIAKGTYYPASTDRSTSFNVTDCSLFGGYGKVGGSYIRDARQFPTILSGNIGDKNLTEDNSYHVIRCSEAHFGRTVLDGFIIEDGNSESTSIPYNDRKGGGMYINNLATGKTNSVTLKNSVFRNNSSQRGGAIYNEYFEEPSNLLFIIDSCIFINNKSSLSNGGAIYNNGSTLLKIDNKMVILNSSFENNSSNYFGGAVYLNNCNQKDYFINCTFKKNSSKTDGAAVACNQFFPGTTNVIFQNCNFNSNIVDIFGEGVVKIYQESSETTDTMRINLVNCNFENNVTDVGCPGIKSYNFSYLSINLDSCIFRKNQSLKSSVIENTYSSNFNLKINNSKFIENSSANNIASCLNITTDRTHLDTVRVNILIENTLFSKNYNIVNFISEPLVQMKSHFNHCTFYNNNDNIIRKKYGPTYSNQFIFNSCYIYNSIFYEKYATSDFLFYNISPTSLTKNNVGDFYTKNCMVSLPDLKYGTTNIDFGGNIFNQYPMFKDTLNGDFRLDSCSPAVNMGYNFITDSLMITKDLAGNDRKFGNVVDIGAYEAQSKCTTNIDDIDFQKDIISIFPNPASDLVILSSKSGKLNELEIYNSSGQFIQKYQLSTDRFSIDIQHLKNGFYVLKLTNTEGITIFKKLIIAH